MNDNTVVSDNPLMGKVLPPVNIVSVGSRMLLECISIRDAYWIKAGNGHNQEYTLSSHMNAKYFLLLWNVTVLDSARYFCLGVKPPNMIFQAYSDVYVGCKRLYGVIVVQYFIGNIFRL